MPTRISSSLIILFAVLLTGQSCSLPFMDQDKREPDGGLYRSDTHGRTWVQRGNAAAKNSIGIRDASIRTIKFDPRNPDRLMVGTYEYGIWISDNAGSTWTPSSIATGDVKCISYKASDPDVQYIGYGSTVRQSLDNGRTWKVVYTDGQRQSITCVQADRIVPTTIWALTSGGKLIRSLDEGRTWSIAVTIKPISPRFIYQDDQVPGHLFIFTRTAGIIDVDTDANAWQDISGGLKKYRGGLTIYGVEVTPGTPTVWTLATKYGILQSFDRGSTWKVIPTTVSPGTSAIRSIALNHRDPREMLITIGTRLHRSTDAGETWSMVNIPTTRVPNMVIFDPDRVDRLFVGTFYVKPS